MIKCKNKKPIAKFLLYFILFNFYLRFDKEWLLSSWRLRTESFPLQLLKKKCISVSETENNLIFGLKEKNMILTSHNCIIDISATNGQAASIYAHIVLLNPLINQILRNCITSRLSEDITESFLVLKIDFYFCFISNFKLSWAASQGSIFQWLISKCILKIYCSKVRQSEPLDRKKSPEIWFYDAK